MPLTSDDIPSGSIMTEAMISWYSSKYSVTRSAAIAAIRALEQGIGFISITLDSNLFSPIISSYHQNNPTTLEEDLLERSKRQAAWYIDPEYGSDSNSGTSVSDALKTWEEVIRRLPQGKLNQDTAFTFLNDLPTTDPFHLSGWDVDRRYSLTFNGTRRTLFSGSLSAATARNSGTNTATQVTDTSVSSWTPYISGGNMLVFTSGSVSGMTAFIAKNLGGNAARISTPFSTSSFTESAPAQNNTYNLVKLTSIPRWSIGAVSLGRTVNFNDIDFYTTTPAPHFISSSAINFKDCRFYATPFIAGFVRYYNCCFQILQGYGGFSLVWAGLVYQSGGLAQNEIEFGQQVQISNGTLFQNCQLSVFNGGYARIYDAAVFDYSGDAVDLHAFGLIRAEALWGSGNTGYGINIRGSGKLAVNGTNAITGSNGAIRLFDTTYSWNDVANADDYIQSATSSACITPM